jgi:hypothetical protein
VIVPTITALNTARTIASQAGKSSERTLGSNGGFAAAEFHNSVNNTQVVFYSN